MRRRSSLPQLTARGEATSGPSLTDGTHLRGTNYLDPDRAGPCQRESSVRPSPLVDRVWRKIPNGRVRPHLPEMRYPSGRGRRRWDLTAHTRSAARRCLGSLPERRGLRTPPASAAAGLVIGSARHGCRNKLRRLRQRRLVLNGWIGRWHALGHSRRGSSERHSVQTYPSGRGRLARAR
jgi:hypothetical protein